MIDRFLGDAFWVLSCANLKLLDCAVSGDRFLTWVCLSVTLLIVDPWQYCIRSGATRGTLLTVLYLDRMCQCGFHAMLWSHIGTQISFIGVLPCCRTSQYRMTFIPHSVSFWSNLANPVFDCVGLTGFKSRANAFLLA